MERFYAAPEAISREQARITGGELKHLRDVLRMKPGERAEVFDGAGRGYIGRLGEIGKTEAVVILEAPVTERRDSPLRICLAQGIPKGERMDWIVQKAAELGVDTILPLELSRCVVRLDGEKKRGEKQIRWQKIAADAARQCGRLTVPKVLYPGDLSGLLKGIGGNDLLLLPWEEGGRTLKSFFAETDNPREKDVSGGAQAGTIYAVIGPEGGITLEEAQAARTAGGHILTLGPRILRADTAGLMLLSVLQYRWGDAGAVENPDDGSRFS